ncbi:MAG: efflux RND transporter periplasmic adaptor subunit [Candidatus Ozemobacteraceae bacterium]
MTIKRTEAASAGLFSSGFFGHCLPPALLFFLIFQQALTLFAAEPLPVTTILPTVGKLTVSERATGELVAPVRATLQMRNRGTVEQLLVNEGERVTKGQLLAKLELVNFQLGVDGAKSQLDAAISFVKAAGAALETAHGNVHQAEVRLETALRDFDRAKALRAKESITQQQYDQIEGAYKLALVGLEVTKKQVVQAESAQELAKSQESVAKVGLQSARQKFEDSFLYAPFGGVVVSRPTQEHEQLGDRSILFVLIDDSLMEITARLPEKFLPHVKIGGSVMFHSEMEPELQPATISAVVPSVDPVTRTFVFKARFSNPDARFRPGSYVDVDVLMERSEQALTLPVEAFRLSRTQGGDRGATVFTVENNHARALTVKLGLESRGRIEVKNGLSSETSVILMGIDRVEDGMSVSARPETHK